MRTESSVIFALWLSNIQAPLHLVLLFLFKLTRFEARATGLYTLLCFYCRALYLTQSLCTESIVSSKTDSLASKVWKNRALIILLIKWLFTVSVHEKLSLLSFVWPGFGLPCKRGSKNTWNMPLSFTKTRTCIFFRRIIAFIGRKNTTEEGSSQVAEPHPLLWQAIRSCARIQSLSDLQRHQSLVAKLPSISAYSTGSVVYSFTGYQLAEHA